MSLHADGSHIKARGAMTDFRAKHSNINFKKENIYQ